MLRHSLEGSESPRRSGQSQIFSRKTELMQQEADFIPPDPTLTVGEELNPASSTESDEPAGQPGLLRVFISYRTDPDAPLASALKKLLESAIEPTPVVFVAGDGGLRPSNLGFKRQLQAAAQDAHAFVAIITNSSKDREWIFFEAGAAWGRDLMYAPVLVGARPEDLPSTIGDYQALKSQSKDDMRSLATSLAHLAGAELRDHFGQRYQTFERTINQYNTGKTEVESQAGQDDIVLAMTKAAQGDTKQANALFDRARNEAVDDEQRCLIEIWRLRALRKPREIRQLLERFDDSLRGTSTFMYHMAFETESPVGRENYLRQAIEIDGGHCARLALLGLGELYFQLGRDYQGSIMFMTVMQEDNSSGSSEVAAKKLVEYSMGLTSLERMLVYFAGLSGMRSEGYRLIYDLASTNNWKSLGLYSSYKTHELESTGSSANAKGVAQQLLGLNCLAYHSYEKSASLGVSVAKCNIAQLIKLGNAHIAALRILEDHKDSFDSVDPGYPYQLRAELERTLHAERETEKLLLMSGQRQFTALWRFAGRALANARSPKPRQNVQLSCGSIRLTLDAGEVSFQGQAHGDITVFHLFEDTVFSIKKDQQISLVAVEGETVESLSFDDFSAGDGLKWGAWTAHSMTDLAAADASDGGAS